MTEQQEKKKLSTQKLREKAAAKVELEYRKSSKSVEYFIDKYAYIEDRDVQDLVAKLNLWDGQKEALRKIIDSKLSIILKARQLGFTWLSLIYGLHGVIFRPGYSVVALSKREEDAKELVRRICFILRYLPSWMIRHVKGTPKQYPNPTWDSTVLSVTIYHKGKEPAVFNAMSAGPDSGRSFTANLVILDEWAFQMFARDIWSAAYPTINRPTGGQVIGLSTAKKGTLFEEIFWKAYNGENTFTPIFMPWSTDPRRTQEWYEQVKKDLPHSYMAEYPATPEEAFTAGEGQFFKEFRRDVHVVKPFKIPSWWKRFCSLDYGLDMCSCHWWAVSPEGIMYAYRELYQPNLTLSQAAKKIISMTPKDEKISYTVASPDLWNRRQETGTSGREIMNRAGLNNLRKAKHDRVAGWRALREYLLVREEKQDVITDEGIDAVTVLTSKLKIFEECKNLIRCLPLLEHDKNDSEDAADTPHEVTHAPEACLIGQTIINTPNGDFPIKDLVGKLGCIYCYDEENKCMSVSTFSDVRLTRENVDVYEIELCDGRNIVATKDHPVLTNSGWKLVEQLTDNDFIIDVSLEVNHANSNRNKNNNNTIHNL